MLLDQICRKDTTLSKDRLLPVKLININLTQDEKGNVVIPEINTKFEIKESSLALRWAVDAANDTERWNRKEAGKEEKPFLGIPFQGGTTQTTTLLKITRIIYKTDLYKTILNPDLKDQTERFENASKLTDPKNIPCKFKEKGGILLPIIGKTKAANENEDGKWVVLGITTPDENIPETIDVETSCLFTNSILGKSKENNQIDIRLHTSGVGKEPFGKEKTPTETEIIRRFGTLTNSETERETALRKLNNLPTFSVNVAPIPDATKLYFSGNTEDLEEIRKIVEEQNTIKFTKKEKKTAKKGAKQEDGIEKETKKVNLLPPIPESVTAQITLCVEESGQKTKLITLETFNQIPIEYWRRVSSLIREKNWDRTIQNFEKCAVVGELNKATPSCYKLWTLLFTNLLHRKKTSCESAWRLLSRYLANFSTASLSTILVGNKYFEISQIIQKANTLVTLEKNGEFWEIEDQTALDKKLETNIMPENLNLTEVTQKLLELLPKEPGKNSKGETKTPSEPDFVKTNLAIIKKGIPEREFDNYAKGFLTGVFLRRAKNLLYTYGRNITIGQGIHLTKLRGKSLTSEIDKMESLWKGLRKEFSLFPNGSIPLLQSMQIASHSNSFNAGFIAGLVTYPH